MLAIPRMDVLSDGVQSAARRKSADQPTSGATSFITVFAGLVGQKSANGISGDKAVASQANAAIGKKQAPAVADARKKPDHQANAKNAAAMTGAGTGAGSAAVTRNAGAKTDGNGAAAQKIQEDKHRNVRTGGRTGGRTAIRSANRSGADHDAMSAAALSATTLSVRTLAAGEQAALRGAACPSGHRADGAGDKAIETIGTSTETRPNGTRVSVVDLRLKAARRQSDSDSGDGQSGKKPASGESIHTSAAPDHGMINAAERLGPGLSRTQAADHAPETPAAAHGSFPGSLAARLRDGAADIVRSAQVVLRNGDVGLIRMRLEPETLGGVKIELKMAEKQISGRIIVESDVAGEAFRSSIDALKDAFAESGFDVRSLEVEVRNSMASGADGRGEDRGSSGTGDGPYWSRSLRELDAAVPTVARSGRDGLLNVLV